MLKPTGRPKASTSGSTVARPSVTASTQPSGPRPARADVFVAAPASMGCSRALLERLSFRLRQQQGEQGGQEERAREQEERGAQVVRALGQEADDGRRGRGQAPPDV